MNLRSSHPVCVPAYLMIHGLFLLFLAPLVGWYVWALLVAAAVGAHAAADWLRERTSPKVVRTIGVIYTAAITLPILAAWFFVSFHSPIMWAAIALATGWVALLLWLKLDTVAAFVASVLLSLAILFPALAREGYEALLSASLIAAAGATVLLTTAFAGCLRKLGAVFFTLLLALFCTMAINDVFFFGMDRSPAEGRPKPGVAAILSWRASPSGFAKAFGTDLRFLELDPFGMLLVGSGRGVFAFNPREVRPLPVGPASDNAAVDYQRHRVYVATRDGRLSLLADEGLGLAGSVPLPRGALVARVAPEGVYALDEWRHVGLYNADTLALQKTWPSAPVSDLLPDGQGGFYLSTLTGRLEHHRPGSEIRTATLRRCGLFHLLALDEEGHRLFVSNMAGRRLQVFDATDLRLLKEVEVDRGCRNLLWEARKNMLLYGSYFDGDLVALNGTTLTEIGRVHLGRRLRTISSDGHGQALVASGGGLFVVDLAVAFGPGAR